MKNCWKRIIGIALTMVFMLTAFLPSMTEYVQASDVCGLEYEVEGDVLTIKGGAFTRGNWAGSLSSVYDGVTTINITGKITSASDGCDLENLFCDCKEVRTINGLENIDWEHLYSVNTMFKGCTNLESIDLSGCNLKNIVTAEGMFEDCESLETVNLGNMTNLRDIQDMFKNCIKLRKIDLSKVNFSNVYYTNNMLKGCDITEIKLPSGFGRKQDTLVNQIRNVMRNGQWKDHTDNKIYQDIPETLYAGHTYVYVKPSGELDLDVDYYVESGEQGGNFVIGKASGGDGDYQYKLIWYDTYEKQLHEGVYTDNRIIEYVYAGWGKYNDRYWNDKARYENIKCDTSDIILYMEVKDGTGKTVRKRVTQVNNWGYEKGLKFDVSVSKPKGSGAFYESRFSTHLRITCNLKGSAGGQMFYKVVVYNRDTKQWGIVKDYTLLDLNVNAKDLNHAYFDTYWPMSVGNRDFYVDILDTSDGTVTRSYGVNYAIGEPDSGAQLMTDKTVAKTGEKVTLTARTDKGDNCQYKYIIYNTSTKQWYMLRDYSSDSTFVWTAGSAGERNIYVDVKDSNGNVTRSNTGKVIVRDASALDIEVSTSCTTASVGDTVKIKAQGKGGVPGYRYCLHYINTASNYYSSECDFTSDNEFEYSLPDNSAGGSMRFWVEVKDAQGSQYCSEIMEVNVSK